MHGVFISSFWYILRLFKAILPDSNGVNTPSVSIDYVSITEFRVCLAYPENFHPDVEYAIF